MTTMLRRLALGLLAALAIATPSGAATGGWRVATSEHFTIYSQESAASLQKFAARLELFDAALRYLFPVKAEDAPPVGRLTIYALPSAGAVQRTMGSGATNVAGVYRPSITGSLALTSREGGSDNSEVNTQLVLLHEYTHWFMLTNFPAAYPTWLVEGFAEFASSARFNTDGSVGIGAPALHRAYDLVFNTELPLARMLADDVGKISQMQRQSLYARGWLLTHMLFFDPKRAGQLDRYIREVSGGTLPAKAAETAFGGTGKLGSDMQLYLGKPRMSYLSIKPTALKPAPVRVTEVSAAESAIIPVRIESKYGVGRPEALRLVPLARAAAAPYPAEPVAQCMLSEAEHDAHNYAEADAAADRILAADAKNYCALLYKGENAMARAAERKAKADDPEWKAARDWFAKANHAEVENPLPMYRYYQTFLAAHAKPSANAADALLGAALRAPQDEGVRVLATAELLRRHEDAAARAMLGPVANSAHNEAGTFLSAIYRDIGTVPDDQLAERLTAGPPEPAAKAATPAGS